MEKVVFCEMCKAVRAFTRCLGCGIALCENCACDVVKTSGHDHVWSISYCPLCIIDPAVNPDAEPVKGKA
ncbi:MAG: hypothetical protein NTZ24_15870 [Deltaproteobacteria bacterium]|nr:hypothetical protein [Deltaproteobacteria bacterium]